jgi:hypothetical protein
MREKERERGEKQKQQYDLKQTTRTQGWSAVVCGIHYRKNRMWIKTRQISNKEGRFSILEVRMLWERKNGKKRPIISQQH